MGGEIWFESEPDRGTRFCFTVPFVPLWDRPASVDSSRAGSGHAPATARSRATTGISSWLRMNISTRSLCAPCLPQAGYHVTVARNGREAVDAWTGGVFDCILMDIQMPRWTATRRWLAFVSRKERRTYPDHRYDRPCHEWRSAEVSAGGYGRLPGQADRRPGGARPCCAAFCATGVRRPAAKGSGTERLRGVGGRAPWIALAPGFVV